MVKQIRHFAMLVLLCAAAIAHGQGLPDSDLHDFGAGKDGLRPFGGVTFDSAGDKFGTTNYGGAYGNGMVWEITASGAYKDLHNFGSVTDDGANPEAGVAVDSKGDLFGTTLSGGLYNRGMIWELTSSGVYEDLHDCGALNNGIYDGFNSYAGVTVDKAGDLFGTTFYGGKYSYGMVWEITASGDYQDLHDFGAGTDGGNPYDGVTIDAAGDLFGVAYGNGNDDRGMVWEITAGGVYGDLHDFGAGTDGEYPYGGVAVDTAGDLFGTAELGGVNGKGMVWELTGSRTYKDLHDFGVGTDGQGPSAAVTLDSAGDLVGTTHTGGVYGAWGTVWEITAAGTYEDLHDFGSGIDGANAYAGVSFDSAGNLYGTTQFGGKNTTANGGYGGGMIWEISVLASVSLNPATVVGGNPSTGTVNLTEAAPLGGVEVTLSSSSSYATVPSSVTVAAGAMSATFTVTTTPYSGTYSAMITARADGASRTADLTVEPTSVSGLTLNPSTVTGGNSSTGTVTLAGPAPSGGVVVKLSSSSPDATLPSTVSISSGGTSANFTIATTPYTGTYTPTITASEGGVAKTALLTVNPTAVSGLTLNPTTVIGGSTSTGTVTLAGPAPSGGVTVKLSSSSPDATLPSTVPIAAGGTSATFTITTTPYSGTYIPTISASEGGVTKTAALTVQPAVLNGLTLNPTTVVGGNSSTGTVTLSGPAPSGGVVVKLGSSSTYATVPSTVTVTAGATSATFTVSTKSYPGTYKPIITAKEASSTETATLTVTPD